MRALKWLIPLVVLGLVAYFVYFCCRTGITFEEKPKMTMDPASIRVEVVNASDVAGAGPAVRDYLRKNGFDVYGERKDQQILPRTRIIDRLDHQMSYARDIQKFLTVPARKLGPVSISRRLQPEIGSEVDSLLYLEAKILLGEDYRKFFPIAPRPF